MAGGRRKSRKETKMPQQIASALFFCLLIHPAVFVAPVAAQEPAAKMTDVTALLLLKDSFVGANPALSSWSASAASSPCDWFGVICVSGKVTGLRLANLGLSGSINVAALAHFNDLRSISLNGNNFAGPLPSDLSRGMGGVKSLFLSYNQFSGEIPSNVFTFGNLKKLWLDHNQLSGPIPDSISNATKLTELRLEDNAFAGTIPSFNLASLKSFNVSNNHLAGRIPASLVRFGAASFAGNPDLCGPPLNSAPCSTTSSPPTTAAETPPQEQSNTGQKVGTVFGIIVAVGALILTMVLIYGHRRRRRRQENKYDAVDMVASPRTVDMELAEAAIPVTPVGEATIPKNGQDSLPASASSNKRSGSNRNAPAARGGAPELTMVNEEKGAFGIADLMKATAEVLGNGGLGSAYKATMANGLTVVVKRMRDMNRAGKEAFDGEMLRLGRLRHPNILTPLAYHYRKEEKLIVSEYAPKGSLLYVLHGDRGADHRALDWPTRLKIARGVARGLAYLHAELASLDVPHGNLKSANILLGNDFEPLIADYGLVALVSATQASQVMFAYRTPEGMQHHLVGPKSDVYCLGVVILELVTGKYPSQYMNNTKGGTDVVQWAASAIAEKREAELLDQGIAAPTATGDMVRLLRIGAACVNPNQEERPEVEEVAVLIEEIENAVCAQGRHGGGQ